MHLVFWAALFLTACGEYVAGTGQRLQVVCSTGLVGDLVANVGGDAVEIRVLIGRSVDPHTYVATTTDVDVLDRADVVFYHGLGFERELAATFERIGKTKKVVSVAKDVPADRLLKRSQPLGSPDPHIWFDVSLWKEAVGPVVAALSEIRPTDFGDFKLNGERYRARLDTLHHWVESRVADVPVGRRAAGTVHDAFVYFNRAYDWKVEGLRGASNRDVDRLVDWLVEHGAKSVFTQSHVSPKMIGRLLEACEAEGSRAEDGGALYTDALGDRATGAETYVGAVRMNIEALVRGTERSLHP